MDQKKITVGFFLPLLFLLLSANHAFAAGNMATTPVWVVPYNYLAVQFNPETRCMTDTGGNDLNATVYKYPESALDTGATVAAVVTKPAGDKNVVAFTNKGDGNYTTTYTFDENGTYKIAIGASHAGYADSNIESYVYVGDFNLLISFLNNNQNIYEQSTSSIRNIVTNQDGNYFTGINGSTTIYYPNSSNWLSGQTMTESGSWEYYYNFTTPSTLGTYSATSTFTCGTNTDSNNMGRFTAITACGNGTCNTWENCSTCNADCGNCPGGPGGGTGGGGPGGGTAAPEEPSIIGYSFGEAPRVAASTRINVEVFNPLEKRSFLVSVKIFQVGETGYSEEQYVLDVGANETRKMALEKEYLPRIAGTHTIEILLFSYDRKTLYDEVVETFDIGGKVKYDVIVQCLDDLVKKGGNASAKITVLNLGDYYEDVGLTWGVEGPDGRTIGTSSLVMALYTNDSKELVRSIKIPMESKRGYYQFKAEVDYKGQKTEAMCSFLVEEDRGYYEKTLEKKEERLRKLVEEVQGKKEEGYSVSHIEEMIRGARIAASNIRAKIEREEFGGLDKEMGELDATIDEIEDAKNRLEAVVSFAPPFGLPEFLTVAALILLIAVASILYQFKNLDGLLGLEEPKKKKRKRGERKKEKTRREKKWKPIEKLLGLQKQQAGKPKKGRAKKRRGKKAGRR